MALLSLPLPTILWLLTAASANAWIVSTPQPFAYISQQSRRQVHSVPIDETDTSSDAAPLSIYSYPALYDLAFGYRDFEAEVRFLRNVHRDVCPLDTAGPQHVLELAAGPARHALEALRQKVASVTCVDVSPRMREYAMGLYETQNREDSGEGVASATSFHYLVQDMRNLDVSSMTPQPPEFDSAWVLLGSMQHLTENQDVLDCFSCVHKALKPGGTLILELPHPRELFGMVDCTRNEWTVPLNPKNHKDGKEEIAKDSMNNDDDEESDGEDEGNVLEIIWGDEDDDFDPIQQVRQATVIVQRRDHSNEQTDEEEDESMPRRIHQIVPMRLFTAQEVDLYARCTGFALVATHGALEEDVSVDDEDEAFRLVCVLQKQ